MTDNDVYNNEKKYKRVINNLPELLKQPKQTSNPHGRKYYIKDNSITFSVVLSRAITI